MIKPPENKGPRIRTQRLALLVAESSPPRGLPPAIAREWRELAPDVRVAVKPGSEFERQVLADPVGFERKLLAAWLRVVELRVQARWCRDSGVPLPALDPQDVQLLNIFGLHPRWID